MNIKGILEQQMSQRIIVNFMKMSLRAATMREIYFIQVKVRAVVRGDF